MKDVINDYGTLLKKVEERRVYPNTSGDAKLRELIDLFESQRASWGRSAEHQRKVFEERDVKLKENEDKNSKDTIKLRADRSILQVLTNEQTFKSNKAEALITKYNELISITEPLKIEFVQRLNKVKEKEKQNEDKEALLDSQQNTISVNKTQIMEERKQIREIKENNKKRTDELNEQQASIDNQNKELGVKLKDIDKREKVLDIRSKGQDEREKNLMDKQKNLDSLTEEVKAALVKLRKKNV